MRRQQNYFLFIIFFPRAISARSDPRRDTEKKGEQGVGQCFGEVTSILDSFRLILQRQIFFRSLKKKSNLQGLYSQTKGK